MQKRNLFLSLFVLFVLPLAAQESVSDSAYTFRFVRGKEMFFVPYRDNVPTLDRLIRRLEACHARLDSGYIYVSVTGYVSPGSFLSVWQARILLACVRNCIRDGGGPAAIVLQKVVVNRSMLL